MIVGVLYGIDHTATMYIDCFILKLIKIKNQDEKYNDFLNKRCIDFIAKEKIITDEVLNLVDHLSKEGVDDVYEALYGLCKRLIAVNPNQYAKEFKAIEEYHNNSVVKFLKFQLRAMQNVAGRILAENMIHTNIAWLLSVANTTIIGVMDWMWTRTFGWQYH